MTTDPVKDAARRCQLGLGLAAVGRPSYINLGRERDLPTSRTVDAMRNRTHTLLDAAYAQGVRYFDVARSYGRSEEFLGQWLHQRQVTDVAVGSKWGYTYTGNWQRDAETHEVKDHSLATYERQVRETQTLLSPWLNLYQIHSLTPESPALTDKDLHQRLADLASTGVIVGFSASGPQQARVIDAALEITVAGRQLFRSVQATYNVLEPSAGPALMRAHEAGCVVIVKEGLANGRLANVETGPVPEIARQTGSALDTVALAAILHQPWVDIVLSGAATVEQLASNLRADSLTLSPDQRGQLESAAQASEQYWQYRSTLPWS